MYMVILCSIMMIFILSITVVVYCRYVKALYDVYCGGTFNSPLTFYGALYPEVVLKHHPFTLFLIQYMCAKEVGVAFSIYPKIYDFKTRSILRDLSDYLLVNLGERKDIYRVSTLGEDLVVRFRDERRLYVKRRYVYVVDCDIASSTFDDLYLYQMDVVDSGKRKILAFLKSMRNSYVEYRRVVSAFKK